MESMYHRETKADRAVMLEMRRDLSSQPALAFEPASRPDFNRLMENTPAAANIDYERAVVGGIAGWWCRPVHPVPNCAVLYLHGGAYVLGSADSYRSFCSQLASRSGLSIFIVDYALAPEHPFPAAILEVRAVARALLASDLNRLVVAGDSAGGGLALALTLSLVAQAGSNQTLIPQAVAVFSPWADLALTGKSLTERADADPLLTRESLATAAKLYLGQHDAFDPQVSPLFGSFESFPPLLLHVGEDEVLLEDSRRVAERATTVGCAGQLHVWEGMVHVFASNLALHAAHEALDIAATFIRQNALPEADTEE